MDVGHRWSQLPEARHTAAVGDFGTLLRWHVPPLGWPSPEAGQRSGYSAATLSRIAPSRRRRSLSLVPGSTNYMHEHR